MDKKIELQVICILNIYMKLIKELENYNKNEQPNKQINNQINKIINLINTTDIRIESIRQVHIIEPD